MPGSEPNVSDANAVDSDSRRTDPSGAPATEPDRAPPSALDRAVPQLSTTTHTGTPPRDAVPPISTTLRSGGARSLIGSTLGRYEVLEEVGHGGMATVYRARDPRLERDVALKVIHRHLRDNPEIAHRFRHEARAVAKLKHPSIVEIYDVPDLDDEERFLVAEFVDGPSLRKYLQQLRSELGHEQAGLMPPEIAAALVLQVLSALARAHSEGIVHRDVKPENILMAVARPDSRDSARGSRPSERPARVSERVSPTNSDRVLPVAKLTDFGIAKILDAQSMTSTGQILGSPAHMAPEQIESGDITPRVDIFATGVLFYELLTGSLPFDGKNPAQVIRRVLEGDFQPADRVAPTVGGRWSAIVASMLAREPEQRPESAEAIAASIREELLTMGVREPDRELLAFMSDPRGVAAGWGERMKPLLLERAMIARERGDVVGSAHDLNRALAYDPTDPKLVRAVTTMRARERRLRGVRRTVPLLFAAILVTGGTYGVVRFTRQQQVKPIPSASATAPTASASAVESNGPVAVSNTVAPPPPDAAAPSASVSITATIAPLPVPIVIDAGNNKRRVRFNVFPAASSYSVDGVSHDPLTEPELDLTVGEHTLTVTGTRNCCEPFSKSFKVPAGDTVFVVSERLTFKPATIVVSGAPSATVTVRRADNNAVIASGPAPLKVPLSETQVPVTSTVEAPGFQPKVETYTLVPGDIHPVSFDK